MDGPDAGFAGMTNMTITEQILKEFYRKFAHQGLVGRIYIDSFNPVKAKSVERFLSSSIAKAQKETAEDVLGMIGEDCKCDTDLMSKLVCGGENKLRTELKDKITKKFEL